MTESECVAELFKMYEQRTNKYDKSYDQQRTTSTQYRCL